ncbi:multicomponent K+:H+ antiporter subunit G [Meinhardsimonia xiamenensis]|jgi:multicomponent K+:H+ antiporter subunit G|uniref:Multicomponent K+:H+ antiporter subunit G n=1 Tax=Meinhardsimonia xiamenensis TaxID=990712 RepID=A0A1G9GL68_9RHOB|nr:Na+/H+ antiporter subunit G [Meinhardsimonia xiamenensis]PRX30561.1 multicomponent K+:H+ antiporter subunit G [Meinhardsimonia xiamenensis]SDL01352.1 multicomponent K+:H+ antiporter subunit G [Meinhardsimonia xiamenensis]
MSQLSEVAISALLVISGLFGLVGSWGLVRLRDTLQRLHAPTKATTLGVGGALLASMLYFALTHGQVSFHELMISVFLFITAPVSANFIAKTHMLHHVQPEELPPTGRATGWAGYEAAGQGEGSGN